MNRLLINIALAFIWTVLTGEFSLRSLLLGLILGYFIIVLASPALGASRYHRIVQQVPIFLGFILWELLKANLQVARDVLSPRLTIQPRVVDVAIESLNDIEITVLANLISMTPGTLSLELSDDRSLLFIHFIHAPDPEEVRHEIKENFERRVLALFRGSEPAIKGEINE